MKIRRPDRSGGRSIGAPKRAPGPRKARISEADRALWDALTREATPLHPADKPPTPPDPAPPVAAPASQPAPAPPPAPSPVASSMRSAIAVPMPVLVVGERGPGMDNYGWASLTRKRLVHWRRLDLHGRTVQAAYVVLHDFLERAHRDGVRHVEIITGLGSGREGGAIRRELPHWLNAPALRGLLLGAAHPHPQNPGAVRVLLRRRKEP